MANKPNYIKPDEDPAYIAHAEIAATAYAGPIPDANQLSKYEQACPGAADRIIAMAEKQSSHRQEIEKIIVQSNSKSSIMGVIFAFLIGLSTVIGGIILAFNGREISGSFIGSAGLVGLVSVFIYGTRFANKKKD